MYETKGPEFKENNSDSHINTEKLPSAIQSLTFNYLEKYMIEKTGIRELNIDILKALQLYNDENGYNMAALLFSDLSSDISNKYGIDIVKFGTSADIIEKRVHLLNRSILEQFDEAEKIFSDYYVVEKIQEMKCENIELVPQIAFREALANVIIHRKWHIGANIQINMYNDHIEILSPEGLSDDVSEKEFLDGRFSSIQNPIIAYIFFRLGIIENIGTGIKQIKQAYDNAPVAPDFLINDNSITIILPFLQELSLTTDEQCILNYISETPVSSGMLVILTGIEKSKLIRNLHSLEKKRLIVSEGQGRSVKYILRK